MIDPIIDAKFSKFREKMGIKNIQDGIAFEQFVNYSILIGHQSSAFNGDNELFEKVNIGGRGDMGIDGLAIKINGIIVRSIEETKSLVNKLPKIEIEFIFIQSKYKQEFTKGEFINFSSGVRDFLSENSKMPHSGEIQELMDIKEYLISEDAVYKWTDNPSVRMYYVTMAKEHDSKTQSALAEMFKEDILRLNTYKEPIIFFVNRKELKSILDSNDNIFKETINFIYSMPLTEVQDVANSCVLLCYATELKKLLKSPDGLIRKSLFDDNVRDFQGRTSINLDIDSTITNEPEKFVLLNNGITIVCDEFVYSNMQITIKNPQIVNGCQTSHVIFNSTKEKLLSKAPVIIKLISTENSDITNQIVKGTNNQNIVPREAFETTKPFHQDLEEFINALSLNYSKFYYERRSKQYDHNPTIMYYQKIDLRIIIQAFVGMFLNSPHIAHKSELELLSIYANQLFLEHQSKYSYFTAALSYYELETLFREGIIEKKYLSPFKMQILMIFRELNGGGKPDINDEQMIEDHCKPLLNFLKNKEVRKNKFLQACDLFDETRNYWISVLNKNQYSIKDNEKFTELLLEKIGSKQELAPRKEDKFHFGKIVHIGKDKNGLYYGYISDGTNEDIFFHAKRSIDFNFEGKLFANVSYKIEGNPRGEAVAVELKQVPVSPKKVVIVKRKSDA